MPRLLPLLLVPAAVLTAGCTAAGEQDATRDETTGEIVENEEVGVFRLQVGDCLVMPSGGIAGEEVETMEAIPCGEPHDGEVLALVTVPGDEDAPFPGQAAVSTQAQEDCVAEFQTATGRDFMTDPDWDLTFLSPTADSWAFGDDREIVCIATPLDGGLTTELAAG